VITGRVADASLTVGPAVYEYDWKWDDWHRLAGASVAGHLIECGAQATGGLFPRWQDLNLADVGYPIAGLEADGSCVITKPEGTGGSVNRHTVAEQLVYEMADPRHYLTPDVDVDFTTVELKEVGHDRVAVRGATGGAASDTYKVSLAYENGYTASGMLLVYGEDCVEKARACGDLVRRRVERAGHSLSGFYVECLGAGEGVPGMRPAQGPGGEVVLRVTACDQSRAAIERFTKEFAPLITSGPPGIAGYASGRPPVRPVFAYWPTLVPKAMVIPVVEVRRAKEWSME
jgi:acyclic terpene utilization AtuA family protein